MLSRVLTSTQLIFDFHILFGSHAKQRGDAVTVRIPVREASGRHAAWSLGGGRKIRVGHHMSVLGDDDSEILLKRDETMVVDVG